MNRVSEFQIQCFLLCFVTGVVRLDDYDNPDMSGDIDIIMAEKIDFFYFDRLILSKSIMSIDFFADLAAFASLHQGGFGIESP